LDVVGSALGSNRLLGLPEPPALWLGYLVPELLVSCIMIVAQAVTIRRSVAKIT